VSERPDSTAAEASPWPASLREGRYRVRGVLGTGSQAETLEADDLQRGVRVAIKRFHVRGARSWKDVELAEREARVLSELRHPSLPAYLEHFEEAGALYLVMEKIEGRTLAELRRDRALDQVQVLRFLRETGETLRYLHGRAPPIIHRDIKPQNVIRRNDGSFALVDFGSVRDRLRSEGGSTVVGTFGYMAPEQFQGRALPVTDVYGVGATAIACLTGEEPEALPHKGLAIDVEAALAGRVDQNLVALLTRLLDPDPDRRPADLSRAVSEAMRFESRVHERRPHADSRSEERRLRKELREARRRRKHERRAAKRERSEQRYPRGERPHVGHSRWWLLLLFVGLLVARISTFALFRLALPLVLGLLAVVLGPKLKRAAERLVEVGRSGDEELRRATARIFDAQESHSEHAPSRRWRVEHSPEPVTEHEEEQDRESEQNPSRKRRL
jgi:serine/threonine protein kinase